MPTNSENVNMEEDEDDDKCKICYCGNEEASNNPLITPCLCVGSMRHVHHDCLVRWMKTAGLERCDLCKHPFALKLRAKPFSEWEMVELTLFELFVLLPSFIFCIFYWGMVVFVIYPWARGTYIMPWDRFKLFFIVLFSGLTGMILSDIVTLRYSRDIRDTVIYAIYIKLKICNSHITVLEMPKRSKSIVPGRTQSKEKIN